MVTTQRSKPSQSKQSRTSPGKFQDTGRLKASSKRLAAAKPKQTVGETSGYRVGRVDKLGNIIGADENLLTLEEAEATVKGSTLVIFGQNSGIKKNLYMGRRAMGRLLEFRHDKRDRKWQRKDRHKKVLATGPIDLWIVVNNFDKSIDSVQIDDQFAGWLADLDCIDRSVYKVTITLPKQQTRPRPRTVKAAK